MFSAVHRGLALALAGQLSDERFNFVEIDRGAYPSWRVAALADVASDLVILWSAELEASPQLPWLLSPDFLDRLVNVSRAPVWNGTSRRRRPRWPCGSSRTPSTSCVTMPPRTTCSRGFSTICGRPPAS